jgi:hydroxyethylthiazole kinase-like uncharacterized protein yjeF
MSASEMVGSWTEKDAARVLREPTAADDKYSRGVLGVRTGSERYPGAAVLGVEAAARTGVGMIRYLGPSAPTSLVLQRRPEAVTAAGRVQAWVIGSGTDAESRSDAEASALRAILNGDEPVVVDAGALDLAVEARAPRILTPHAREFAALCRRIGIAEDSLPRDVAVARAADRLGSTVLLKGARTLVAASDGTVFAIEAGTPWLATAGTGDVLAGVLGALVAGAAARGPLGAAELAQLAATGAWIHGAAARVAAGCAASGDIAAGAVGDTAVGHPLAALDVAEALPAVVSALLDARRIL